MALVGVGPRVGMTLTHATSVSAQTVKDVGRKRLWHISRIHEESWADVVQVIMASFAMVLLIYAACSVIIEFTYRHLVARPMA